MHLPSSWVGILSACVPHFYVQIYPPIRRWCLIYINTVKGAPSSFCPFPDDVIDGLCAISRCRCQATVGDCIHLIRGNIKLLATFLPCIEPTTGSIVKATEHQSKNPGADHSDLSRLLGKRRGGLVGKKIL